MRAWAFNEFDGRQLKKLAKERHLNSVEESLAGRLGALRTTQRTYIVYLSSPIAAAVSVGGGDYAISAGIGTVKTRSHAAGELYSADPANTIASLSLITATTADGSVTVRVFNATTSVAPANTPLLAVQDVAGDLWLVIGGSTSQQAGTRFYNASGMSIPPYAVMQATGGKTVVSGLTYADVVQPGQIFNQFSSQWLINGVTTIVAGDVGLASMNKEYVGAVIMGDATPVFDSQQLGPRPGSWGLWPHRMGFEAVGEDYDNTDGLVHAVDCLQTPVKRVFGRLYGQLTQNADGNAFAEFEIWCRNANSGFRFAAGWGHLYTYAPLMNNGDIARPGAFGYADLMTIGVNIWEGDFACDPDNSNSTQYTPQGFSSNWEDFTFSGPDGSGSIGDVGAVAFF